MGVGAALGWPVAPRYLRQGIHRVSRGPGVSHLRDKARLGYHMKGQWVSNNPGV